MAYREDIPEVVDNLEMAEWSKFGMKKMTCLKWKCLDCKDEIKGRYFMGDGKSQNPLHKLLPLSIKGDLADPGWWHTDI
jgi:hypothetical protein